MEPDPDVTVLDGRRVLLLVGVGEHGDPWHALEATGGRAAAVLRDAGASIGMLRTDRPEELTPALADADVLLLAVSGDPALPPPDSSALVSAIHDHTARGGGVLALHSSTLAFAGDPRWRELLGGRWVPGVSDHPPIGEARVQPARPLPGLPVREFLLHDERYTDLELSGEVGTVAFHTEGGIEHPLVWVRHATATTGRVAYDALGHGVESYDSAAHRELLVALASWVAPAAPTVA